jgi:nucleolar protein 56
MVVHIAECVLGVFAFDDSGEMLDSMEFPRDVAQVAGRLASVQMGVPTEEHRALIAKLMRKKSNEFIVESEELANQLSKEFKHARFEVAMPNKAGEILRSDLEKFAAEAGVENVKKFVHDVNFLLTRDSLHREATQRDKLIIQAINMLDEIDKTANIICGRVREWYSIHFPELDRLVPEHQHYMKLVLALGPREKFTPAAIKAAMELPDKTVEKIVAATQSSLGSSFDQLDIDAIQGAAKEIFSLFEAREKTSGYIDGLMAQVAPNIRAVVGSSIGARLISLAGGLTNLARMPASTLQILGAEKALFRALRSRARPPKHGVIYQYPDIRGVPKWQRGKVARALAGKLSIAARVDAMSGEFIGEKLAANLRARIADIKTKYEKPREER